MNYNLEITPKQLSLIRSHIIDLCNIRLYTYSSLEEVEKNTKIDEYDKLRAAIYFKEIVKRGKVKQYFSGLTQSELIFISHEIRHFVLNDYFEFRDRYEILSAKALVKKIDHLLDKKHQRNVKLKSIGI